MPKFPFMKFYPADWLQSPELRLVSLAARGLWIELLCYMHQATPRGHLLIGGKPITNAQIARVCGEPEDRVNALLEELESLGVLSRSEGVIINRRMIREGEISGKRSDSGKQGGRPAKSKPKAKRKQTETNTETKLEPECETKPESKQESKPLASSFFVTVGNKSAATTIPLPVELSSDAFVTAYSRFVAMRRENRKPVTQTAAEEHLEKLARWAREKGLDYAIAAVKESTAGQWQGIFEPKNWVAPPPKTRPLRPDELSTWNPFDGGSSNG